MWKWLLVCSFLPLIRIYSQKRAVFLHATDQHTCSHIEKYNGDEIDSSRLGNFLIKLQVNMSKKGYPLFSIDSIQHSKQTIDIQCFVGPYLPILTIEYTPQLEKLLRDIGLRNERILHKLPIGAREITILREQILTRLLNAGYPFAQITLTQPEFKEHSTTCQLIVEPGKRYKNGQFIVKGDTTLSKAFISTLAGFSNNKFFDESLVSQMGNRLVSSGFVEEIKPPELLFTDETVDVYVYLRSKKVSSVNGALGLQPNPVTNRIALTGDLNVRLQNTLKKGEIIQLNWRSIQAQTQQVNALLNIPFLFGTPFGVESQFFLYKRDTTFLDLRSTSSVQYLLKNGNTLKTFYQFNGSSLLSGSKNNSSFTNLSNTRTNAYGLSLSRKKLDYLPNPTKGWVFNLECSVGKRKSRQSDTLQWNVSTTYRLAGQSEWFYPLRKRHVLRLNLRSAWYSAPVVFQNEAFRIGGLNSLRGFNEEEIFSTFYTIMGAEYRFLLDKNSNVFVFFDQAITQNKSVKKTFDAPFGFGGGLSFGTNVGIFSLSYALGKQLDNPIQLRNGKIHFGYIAFF